MPYFPLFIDPAGRRCVVVGGGPVAVRKVKTLLDFGADVAVFDPSPSEAVRELLPLIALTERQYAGPEDLTGALLVIAATDNHALHQKLAEDAKTLGIPVNVADDPNLCTFFFPAVVRRGELVAGLSTSGACPRLAARLRAQLETLWSPALGESLETLKAERQKLRSGANSREEICQHLDRLITALTENTVCRKSES
ncbi:MAG: bifunctional precorrin-2 dehydrogenase/sirohydrochlorin ferrochelatase [Spirochaetaceae bacterium]|jgi:siroheme synthase-like protein|nr:bifunctional precorrin-2 dehydrogenase/sirohydrochlorin ferrochelatase [Spirochaetaceae bacterium]